MWCKGGSQCGKVLEQCEGVASGVLSLLCQPINDGELQVIERR